jgi:hypothetical protein
MRRALSLLLAATAAAAAPKLSAVDGALEHCGMRLEKASPIHWKACAMSVGRGCREMVADWPLSPALAPYRVALGAAADVSKKGDVTLMFSRVTAGGFWRVIADADGPVRFSLHETSPRCALGLPSLHEGRFAWRLYDDAVLGRVSEYGGAALVGRLDRRGLELTGLGSTAPGRRFIAAGDRVLELDPNAGGLRLDGKPVDADGPVVASVLPVGGALFAQVRPLTLRLYSPASGAREFLRGAADLGSDGHSLAWAEARPGRAELYTAPFTLDPERLERRALATVSDVGLGLWPFVVFGTKAARLAVPAGVTSPDAPPSVLVFDLASGRSHEIHGTGAVVFRQVLAVTRTEVFVMADVQQVPTLIRLNLETES